MGELLEALPAGLVDALERPGAFPHDPDPRAAVEHVQTHISHVFLTPRRVYKLRKAVDPGFLHFGTRALRDADCVREVSLNRRLAPDVYLGVAAIRPGTGGPQVGEERGDLSPDAIEHCVVMRRLPTGRDLKSLLEAGLVEAPELSRIAAHLARFHARVGLGTPAPFDASEWRRRIWEPVEESCNTICRSGDAAAAGEALFSRARAGFESRLAAFETRRAEGRAVDGHGDLHLDHVWLETAAADPLFVDCIEFSEDLRHIDAAADVAFLAMDLCYRGRDDLAWGFLSEYAALRDDFGLFSVVDFFMSYRAAVRAKVAALANADAAISAGQRALARQSLERHVELALRLLDPPTEPVLVVTCGSVGSGKTTVARHIASRIGAVLMRSDQLRKQILSRGADLYSPERKSEVYAGLRERAARVIRAGRPVVVDATFARAHERRNTARLAEQLGVRLVRVEVRCDAEVAHERLAERAREGADLSDAGPERLDASVRAFEAIAPDEPGERLGVDTTRPEWVDVLERKLAESPSLTGHLKGSTDLARQGGVS